MNIYFLALNTESGGKGSPDTLWLESCDWIPGVGDPWEQGMIIAVFRAPDDATARTIGHVLQKACQRCTGRTIILYA